MKVYTHTFTPDGPLDPAYEDIRQAADQGRVTFDIDPDTFTMTLTVTPKDASDVSDPSSES